jgi:hypothetical protein
MGIYKITSLTNMLGKRELKSNSELEFDYVEGMVNRTVKIRPGSSVFLDISRLPLSLQKLRVKNLIAISEITEMEMNEVIEARKPKQVIEKNTKKNEETTKKIVEKKKHEKKEEE